MSTNTQSDHSDEFGPITDREFQLYEAMREARDLLSTYRKVEPSEYMRAPFDATRAQHTTDEAEAARRGIERPDDDGPAAASGDIDGTSGKWTLTKSKPGGWVRSGSFAAGNLSPSVTRIELSRGK